MKPNTDSSQNLLLRALCGSLLLIAFGAACSGEPQTAGSPISKAMPEAVVIDRDHSISHEIKTLRPNSEVTDQILFGDLHVHSTFSGDAFVLSLPMMGGEGAHPPADACDFARFCSGLDFFSLNDHAESSTPRLWSETVDSITQCNAVAGQTDSPDLVAFLGWEWTQVGTTPENHFGHKNVVLRDFTPGKIPARPIAAPREEFRVALLPTLARWLLPLMNFGQRQRYFDYSTYASEVQSVPLCPQGIPSPDLPLNCHEVASTPRDLFAKLDDWNVEALVIPHGSTWGLMTPPGFDIAKELQNQQHDPDRQVLFEVYSGHGTAELHRNSRAAIPSPTSDRWTCPAPTEDFLPCCWRAGEIVAERCEEPESAQCQAEIDLAQERFVKAGVAGHQTIPGAKLEDWQDCDQCRSCDLPAYSHRSGGSAQAALAATGPRQSDGSQSRFRFGLIGSSDTHDARSGNGFKEFGRIQNTEAPYVAEFMSRNMRDDRDPVAASEPVALEALPLAARRYTERGASFLSTGGLVAVHAPDRKRESIWNALAQRQVYGTSGDRILLWFDLLNGGDGQSHPMGSDVVHSGDAPQFSVTAVGALEQQPGCPDHVLQTLGPARLTSLCLGECHHPGDRRHRITRIEIVRIRAALGPEESVGDLVEDPWKVLTCPDQAEGCRVEFSDPGFEDQRRETIYYVRAIQEPTLAINAGGLRCEFDSTGRCQDLDPCYGDSRTPKQDDCLAPYEERAWSSPIFLRPQSPLSPSGDR